jgi:choline dehydrogenase-like flavoprotein
MHTGETNVDVLIIGAGPAGLFASNALARAGINVKIIDKRYTFPLCLLKTTTHDVLRPVKLAVGQADGIQPRTIEVLQVRAFKLAFQRSPKAGWISRAMDWQMACLRRGHSYTWQYVQTTRRRHEAVSDAPHVKGILQPQFKRRDRG